MTIFEAIREDHETQRTLVDLLVKTEGDSDGREELFSRLKDALRRHARAEERYFYAPLLKDDLTQEKSRHSVHEHETLDELVAKLEETDMSSPGWLPTARKLRDEVLHHLEEEEHEVFQLAGKVLTDADKEALATRYRTAMAEDA